MNDVMPKEKLEQILDQAVQDVTECTAGVCLRQENQLPGDDLCTVEITFDRVLSTSITLCADTGLLHRMACNSFHEESVSPDDLEEFSKEYFNVLCGRIAGAIFRSTQIPVHFGPPMFYRGYYEPEGHEAQFVLTYSDECNGGAQLIYHVLSANEEGAVSDKG